METLTAFFKPAPKVDVYLSTKRQIESTMSNTDNFVSQYKSKFCKPEDLIVLAKQIEVNIRVIEDLIASISSTIDPKDNAPDTQTKRTFIATTRSKIVVIKNAVRPVEPATSNKPQHPTMVFSNQKKALMDTPIRPRNEFAEPKVYSTSDEEILLALQAQKKAMAESDELLDALLPSITQLKHISLAMHTELKLQNNLLEKLDTEVDKTNINLNQANKKTVKLSKQL